MTSKEAIKSIEKQSTLDFLNYDSLCLFEQELKVIQKELEVLEILKKSIFNKEEHIRRMSEPKGEPFLMLNLHVNGEENIKKVKEILK